MDVDGMLALYETHLRTSRGAGTVRLRLHYLGHFRAAHPDLATVTIDDVEAFLTARLNLAAETRKSMRASLRSFYGWAHKKGYLPVDPTADLDPIRVPATVPRMAPDDRIVTALTAADPRARAVILLGRLGCLRRAEIAGLHMRDRVGRTLNVTGKGEKERRVPCPPDLLTALVTLEEGRHGYYFPGGTDGHIHPATVGRIITALTDWNPHSLRHAGATASYRATSNLRSVQELLGHSNVATTQRYVHVDDDELWAAAMGTALT